MADDGVAAEEIARQIAALRPRVQGSEGVMAYLEKPQRSDVNKLFLASTIRGVNSHNRRQEEDKCWKLRTMEQKLDERSDRRGSRRDRSRSRSRARRDEGRKRRRSRSRSRSRSRRRRRRDGGTHRSRSRSPVAETKQETKEDESERDYWARKKAEKTKRIWEDLNTQNSVMVENAPDFSSEESDDDDVKPAAVELRSESVKQRKQPKRGKKSIKKRSRSYS